MEAARTSVPKPGTLVNSRYRVGSSIGEGGMGVVLAARDEREGRDVAIKLLQVVGEQNIERFLREAKLSMKIDSEHVVRVLDVGQLNGNPFFVMERLDGEDFGQKVREGELGLTEVADCIVQTCEALAHAHGTGIVHRDIKASNLFEHRLPDGSTVVKVLDFGISKHFATNPNEVERTLTRTRDGGFLGSPPYMSPEHVKDPRNVDGRSDLWSLGVVAYRLLSTQFPFPGETTGEVLAAILEGNPKRLREHHVQVPEAVDKLIIEQMLARKREERCSDAGVVARAFAPYCSPRWRSYGERVTEVVSRGIVPAPVERSAKRKAIAEPRTATVPPPVEEEPATLALDDEAAKALLPPAASSSITGPVRIASASLPATPIPSPLEVLSSASLPILLPVEEKPKSRAGLVIGLLLSVLVGAGLGTGYVITHRAPPPSPTFSSPPPTLATTPEPAIAPTPTPAASTASILEATAPPVDSHPSARAGTKKPAGRPPVRPSPAPAAAPAPPPAPKKNELEKNPYAGG
ncbi:MAG: serine/threonine-protein kinase [Labilithrix sp.]